MVRRIPTESSIFQLHHSIHVICILKLLNLRRFPLLDPDRIKGESNRVGEYIMKGNLPLFLSHTSFLHVFNPFRLDFFSIDEHLPPRLIAKVEEVSNELYTVD